MIRQSWVPRLDAYAWFDSLSLDLYDFFSVLIQVLFRFKKIVSKKTEFLRETI